MIRIEDNFEDVLGKAGAGLGFNAKILADMTGLERGAVKDALHGRYSRAVVEALAEPLGLHAPSLVALGEGTYRPGKVEPIDGLFMDNTPFPVPGYAEMTVNSYLVWDPRSKSAAAFDTGANTDAILARINEQGLTLELILLTHAHRDHIAALAELRNATGTPPAYVSDMEPVRGAETFGAGRKFLAGSLHIETRPTPGHSPGGTTYVIEGLQKPVAIVGDALFAGSMGGAAAAYDSAREHIRNNILTLPGDTLLCPGHGPMTTVANELAHNPFFAG